LAKVAVVVDRHSYHPNRDFLYRLPYVCARDSLVVTMLKMMELLMMVDKLFVVNLPKRWILA
jgi:hypothetical protein